MIDEKILKHTVQKKCLNWNENYLTCDIRKSNKTSVTANKHFAFIISQTKNFILSKTK